MNMSPKTTERGEQLTIASRRLCSTSLSDSTIEITSITIESSRAVMLVKVSIRCKNAPVCSMSESELEVNQNFSF